MFQCFLFRIDDVPVPISVFRCSCVPGFTNCHAKWIKTCSCLQLLSLFTSMADYEARPLVTRPVPKLGAAVFNHVPEKDKIVIIPKSHSKNGVVLETIHISCKSDEYLGHSFNYGGVIIYQYNGNSDWRTANNTHCKTGYIVIQDTDSENIKRWMSSEPGIVHGAVYRNAFGESVKDAEVVGEGFAVRNGKFEICSSVFNNPQGSAFHDQRRQMHELSRHCVKKVVRYWKRAGPSWVKQRNFGVKQLLEDFDFDSL